MRLWIRTQRGVAWMASGEVARQATQFVTGVVLARLLTPPDFGLLAMAMFVIGFIEVSARCGITEALIQRPEPTDDDWSSAYWVEVGRGMVVGAAAWSLAPAAAWFYRDERVAPILRMVAWGALIESLGTTQAAWLSKRLHFRTIALAEWAGVLAGGATAMATAWIGWGVWSLVVNYLVSAATTSGLLVLGCAWRPRWRLRLSTLRWAVRFGLGYQGFLILNHLNRRLDDALIGRYVGPGALGYYSRAYQLMLYPVQNITGVLGRVMYPALTEIREDFPRFRRAYLQVLRAIAMVTFPAMLGLLVTAPELVAVLYGPQWTPTVPLLQVLCVVGLLQSITSTVGWIYLTQARTDLMFLWGVVLVAVILPSFLLGIHWGAMGVAVAYAGATALLTVPYLVIPFRLIGLPLAELVRAVRGLFLGAVVMSGLVAAVREGLLAGQAAAPVVLAGSVATGVATYLAWLWFTKAGTVQDALVAWTRAARLQGSEAPK